MAKVKKENTDMQTNTETTQLPPLPIPQGKKRMMQGEVNLELWEAAHKEMKRKGIKIRQVLEFGLRAFLLQSNPEAARKLSITAKG